MNVIWSKYVQGAKTLYYSRKLRFDDMFAQQYKTLFDLDETRRLKILEIGCGPGALAGALHCWYPDAEIIAVDRDSEFIRFAREQEDGVTFMEGDITELPFEDNSFDVVISNTVSEHIEPSRFYGEQCRILKPDGICLVLSSRKGIVIPPDCAAPDEKEQQFWKRVQQYDDTFEKYAVHKYPMNEAELPAAMEQNGFGNIRTGFVTVDLTPDNPKYSADLVHSMIDADRYSDIESIDSVLHSMPEYFTMDEIEEMKCLANKKYDTRIAQYERGEKQWDTSVSIIMVIRGIKRNRRIGRMSDQKSSIQYRELCRNEINRELFWHFVRHQKVTDCWRKENGKWVIKKDPFIDDWSEEDYGILVDCLRRTAATGGFVYGAFCDGHLKGFVSVEPELFGGEQRYLDLSSLHVSEDMRGRGIGKILFAMAREQAGKRGAGKLYISAHSAVESQAFYKAMGCVEAKVYNRKHVEEEPYDCQLECRVDEIYLKKPVTEDAGEIEQFRREIRAAGDRDSFAGCFGLAECESVEKWIKDVAVWGDEEICPEDHTPSDMYMAVRYLDHRMVGMIDLRHNLNNPVLREWGGHIGYSVRPDEREKGYAKEMLRLDLIQARKLGLEKVMIACDCDNAASEKTILANGGMLEKEIMVEGTMMKKYWILL